MTTLREDFAGWWEVLPKYRKREIEARDLYGDDEVRERIADSSGKMWKELGGKEDVKYFVRLWVKKGEPDVYVGFYEPRDPVTNRRKRYAEFPIHVKNT